MTEQEKNKSNSGKTGERKPASGKMEERKTASGKVEERIQRKINGIDRLVSTQEKFLEKNQAILTSLRARDEAVLRKNREQHNRSGQADESDDRRKNGNAAEKSLAQASFGSKGRSGAKANFGGAKAGERVGQKGPGNNRSIAAEAARTRHQRREVHRQNVDERYRRRAEVRREWMAEAREKEENRLKRVQNGEAFFGGRRLVPALIVICAIVIIFLIVERIIPGSHMKKKKAISDTSVEEASELLPEKEYDRLPDGVSETQYLWNTLMKHFNNNETAVLGIMCNLHEESRFKAGNLEDYNNEIWSIDDDTYTEGVNRRTIGKKDFLEARNNNETSGYYNSYDQWVNLDGGYGYCQFTAYDQKEALYQFAEQWFGPGGKGENKRFNIADVKMQTDFLIYLLESDSYKSLDSRLREATTVADSCYLWLSEYEIPYDPYCDGYYTLAFERAESADEILAECKGKTDEGEPK